MSPDIAMHSRRESPTVAYMATGLVGDTPMRSAAVVSVRFSNRHSSIASRWRSGSTTRWA